MQLNVPRVRLSFLNVGIAMKRQESYEVERSREPFVFFCMLLMQYKGSYIALKPVFVYPLAQTGEETRGPQLLTPRLF